MIVRITLVGKNKKDFIMLFGDSYKTWQQQFKEYMWRNIRWYDTDIIMQCNFFDVKKVEYSDSQWKGWGGLKWCEDCDFQNELNREGVQQNEPDNPTPRQYDEMEFYESKGRKKYVKGLINGRLRGLKGKSIEEILFECSNYT